MKDKQRFWIISVVVLFFFFVTYLSPVMDRRCPDSEPAAQLQEPVYTDFRKEMSEKLATSGVGELRPASTHCEYIPKPEPPSVSLQRGDAKGYLKLVVGRVDTEPAALVVTDTVDNVGFLQGHMDRERLTYKVLNVILKFLPEKEIGQFIDAGSNHGLFAIDAALNGIPHIYAIEPQPLLRQRMRSAFRLNDISAQIDIFPNAVYYKTQKITLTSLEFDGGIAHIDLISPKAPPNPVSSTTTRLDCVPIRSGPIAALKIDIEGFELFGLESAAGLFLHKRVRHVLVEFGPPSRWEEYKTADANKGIAMIKRMYDDWGFDFYLLPSQGYDYMRASGLVDEYMIPGASKFLHLPREKYDNLRDHLQPAGELFVWWQLRDDPIVQAFWKKYVTRPTS